MNRNIKANETYQPDKTEYYRLSTAAGGIWYALYVRDYSLRLDLKILFSTIPQILMGKSVVEGYAHGTEAEPELLKTPDDN